MLQDLQSLNSSASSPDNALQRRFPALWFIPLMASRRFRRIRLPLICLTGKYEKKQLINNDLVAAEIRCTSSPRMKTGLLSSRWMRSVRRRLLEEEYVQVRFP